MKTYTFIYTQDGEDFEVIIKALSAIKAEIIFRNNYPLVERFELIKGFLD